MRLGILLLVVGCSSPEDAEPRLPGATHSPHLQSSTSSVACGSEVAFYGSSSPDIVYAYTYNAAGALVHSEGVHAWGGPNHTSDYTYNAAGNLTHSIDQNVYGDTEIELTIQYDAADQMTGYAYDVTSPDWSGTWTAAYSSFLAPHQPAREVTTFDGQSMGYDLSYDSWGRLVAAEADSGELTTWAYDDQNLTITYDHGGGAWTGVVQFAADGRILTESWGGSDPQAVPQATVYSWTGNRLDTIAHSYDGDLVETDTFLYSCAAARANTGRTVRVVRPARRAR